MKNRTAETKPEPFQLIRGFVPKCFTGFELAFDFGQLFFQLAEGIDSRHRIFVAKPERQPEEQL